MWALILSSFFLVGVLGDVCALGVEALVRVSGVVDELELAVVIEEPVAPLHEAVLVPLLITELTVVPGKKKRREKKKHFSNSSAGALNFCVVQKRYCKYSICD